MIKRTIVLQCLAALLLWMYLPNGALAWQASATNPTLPLVTPQKTRPAPTGSAVFVHDMGDPSMNGTNLQNAYTSATCGQDIILDDGVTYSGNFIFNKQCSAPNWTLIEGTGCSSSTTPIPTYASTTTANAPANIPLPIPALTHYPKITSTNGASPISMTDGTTAAKYNYVGCIDTTANLSQAALIAMVTLSETVIAQLPDHLMFDRMYVHGVPASSTVQMNRGFLAGGSMISIVNSYVSNIYSSFGDAQAILIGYGTAGYLIQNNFLEGSSEIIMAGGTGRTPGYSCTIAASPAPTTTSATANTCIDANGGSVATPAIGTNVMFKTSAGSPAYVPQDWTTITGNTAGALTFTTIPTPPIAGAAKVVWGIVPSDITITLNYLFKPPSWNPSDPTYDSVVRSSKDFVEDKYGVRWLVTANVMVNSWNNGQSNAFNINVTDQNGDCPWCTSSDVTVSLNVVKNISGLFGIITSQDYNGQCPGPLKRVLIQNNLFWPAGASAFILSGGSNFLLAGFTGCPVTGGGTDSLQIIHNHLLGPYISMQLSGGTPYNFTNLVIRDNIVELDQYRWTNQCADGMPANVDGTACIMGDVSTGGLWTIKNNAIINSGAVNGGQGQPDSVLLSRYSGLIITTLYDTTPAMGYSLAPFASYSTVNLDYHGFALAGAGPWRNSASDGTDPGACLPCIDIALSGSPPPAPASSILIPGANRIPSAATAH